VYADVFTATDIVLYIIHLLTYDDVAVIIYQQIIYIVRILDAFDDVECNILRIIEAIVFTC